MSNKFYNKRNNKVGKYKGAGPVYNQFKIQDQSVSFNVATKKDPKYSECKTTYCLEVINNEISYYVECDYVE